MILEKTSSVVEWIEQDDRASIDNGAQKKKKKKRFLSLVLTDFEIRAIMQGFWAYTMFDGST